MKKILIFVLSLMLLSTSGLATTQTLLPNNQYVWFGSWSGFGNCALGNPSDFWQCLDDYSSFLSDNSGVQSTTSNAEIQLSMTDLSSNLGLANSVTFKYRSKEHPRSGPKCYEPLVSVENIPYNNETCNFLLPLVCDTSSSWTTHSFTVSLNPCTELAWRFAEINHLMVGMKAKTGAYPAGGYVDAVWAVVDY